MQLQITYLPGTVEYEDTINDAIYASLSIELVHSKTERKLII